MLDNVQKLWQTGSTATSVTIQWDPVSGATGYRVYRYDANKQSFQPILNTKEPTCTLQDLATGESVRIKIKAFQEKDGKTNWSDASPVLTAATTPDVPTALKQKNAASDKVTLSWKASAGATGYQIYQYDNASGSYKKVATSARTTCIITALKPSTEYRFTVRALYKVSDKTLESGDSATVTARTGPAKVTGLTQKDTTTQGYTLSWKKSAGATGYRIYSVDLKTNKATLIGKTAETTYTIKKQTAGQMAAYRVRAYTKRNGTSYNATVSDTYQAAARPAQTTGCKQYQASDNSVWLKWKAVSNATSYGVYRYTGDGWKKVKTVKKAKAVITALPSDTTMKFRVRAFIQLDGRTLSGKYSATFKAETDQ